MPATRPGYSTAQIALHWTIAVLVILQVALHDGMVAAFGARRGDGAATESEALLADLHVAFGIAVFVLALLRVALRVTRGAPPPPEAEHRALRTVARATHLALYAIILAMPVTGGPRLVRRHGHDGRAPSGRKGGGLRSGDPPRRRRSLPPLRAEDRCAAAHAAARADAGAARIGVGNSARVGSANVFRS